MLTREKRAPAPGSDECEDGRGEHGEPSRYKEAHAHAGTPLARRSLCGDGRLGAMGVGSEVNGDREYERFLRDADLPPGGRDVEGADGGNDRGEREPVRECLPKVPHELRSVSDERGVDRVYGYCLQKVRERTHVDGLQGHGEHEDVAPRSRHDLRC